MNIITKTFVLGLIVCGLCSCNYGKEDLQITYFKQYNEITDNTLITSMKLTCGSEYKNITSDIYVKAFTYLSNDDFDDNGYYRGKSFDEVTIKNLSM